MAVLFITGATGFIGRHLVSAVLDAGDEAVCLVRPSSDRRDLQRSGLRLVEGDMLDESALRRALQGADAAIHAAAMLKAPWRREFADANIRGTAAVAAACRERATPLVVVSSLAAAGPAQEDAPRTEAQPPAPVSLYGRIKLQAEQVAIAMAHEVPLTIVRPPMVFGEGDRSALALFRMAARGWQPLPGGADRRLSLIHAADLAWLLHRAALSGERVVSQAGAGRGLYYACADEAPTVSGLAAAIAQAQQRPPPRTLPVPLAVLYAACATGEIRGRLTDTPQLMNLDKYREMSRGPWWCSAGKARRGLDFRPLPLDARLRQTAQWYRQQRWLGDAA